jgi:hypothetical protein
MLFSLSRGGGLWICKVLATRGYFNLYGAAAGINNPYVAVRSRMFTGLRTAVASFVKVTLYPKLLLDCGGNITIRWG